MLSLISGAIGLFGSFAPKLMDYFQDKQDKAHELKMINAQAEIQERIQEGKLEATKVDASIREIEALHREHASITRKASRFFINLSSSIRPVITYLFVIEYVTINAAIAVLMFREDGITIETLSGILNEDFMVLLTMVVTFWFGSRAAAKWTGRQP